MSQVRTKLACAMLQQKTSVRPPVCSPQARHMVAMRASVCAASASCSGSKRRFRQGMLS
ncbi:hypothetical protein BH11MYX4_BH11MYX4_05080 [soil metagenome]